MLHAQSKCHRRSNGGTQCTHQSSLEHTPEQNPRRKGQNDPTRIETECFHERPSETKQSGLEERIDTLGNLQHLVDLIGHFGVVVHEIEADRTDQGGPSTDPQDNGTCRNGKGGQRHGGFPVALDGISVVVEFGNKSIFGPKIPEALGAFQHPTNFVPAVAPDPDPGLLDLFLFFVVVVDLQQCSTR